MNLYFSIGKCSVCGHDVCVVFITERIIICKKCLAIGRCTSGSEVFWEATTNFKDIVDLTNKINGVT